RSRSGLIEDAGERSFHVGRRDLRAVREFRFGVELEGQRQPVGGERPARRDGGNDVVLRIEPDQRLVNQLEQAERGERGLLVRVEPGGVLRPCHAQGCGGGGQRETSGAEQGGERHAGQQSLRI